MVLRVKKWEEEGDYYNVNLFAHNHIPWMVDSLPDDDGPPPMLWWDVEEAGELEAELDGDECLEISEASSIHLSWLRRRAFIKKLPTVLRSKPNCCEMVICISLEGLLVSLNIAWRVLLCKSVKTKRGFLGAEGCLVVCCCSSFRLQAVNKW